MKKKKKKNYNYFEMKKITKWNFSFKKFEKTEQRLSFFLVAFFIIAFTLAILFDSSRSFFNLDSKQLYNVSIIFNPIADNLREVISTKVARSVILLFFSFVFLYKAYTSFANYKHSLFLQIFVYIFLALSLTNIVLYFAYLSASWQAIFIFSLQIFVLIALNFVHWWLINKKNQQINYDFVKFFWLKIVSYLSQTILFLVFAIIFGVLALKYKTVTVGNPITDWLYKFVAQIGTTTNSAILVAILSTILILISVSFSTQIYFYKNTYLKLSKTTTSLSFIILPILTTFVYHIFVAIFTNQNFALYLIFNSNFNNNYLKVVGELIFFVIFASAYSFLFFYNKLRKFTTHYSFTIFMLTNTLFAIVSFLFLFNSISAKENVWIWLISASFVIYTYLLFAIKNNEMTQFSKAIVGLVLALYLVLQIFGLWNFYLYSNSVVSIKSSSNRTLNSVTFIDYSWQFFAIFSVFTTLLTITNLVYLLAKNIFIWQAKTKLIKERNV